MAATPSVMLALGTRAPDFSLPDVVSGKEISLKDVTGKRALLVMFISRHCPYVQHVKSELARIGKDYVPREVGIVAVCSNDIANYPDDAPAKLKEMAEDSGFNFPFCYDEGQAVAKAFSAACTPDFFLFDSGLKLVYRGQLDGSRPSNSIPVTGRDLRSALDAVLARREVSQIQSPSIGCNIKWKAGNEPEYARATV
jgi:peroxiredoxin